MTFIIGDNLEEMDRMDDDSFDLVFFSPPYPGLAGCEMGVWEWFAFIRRRFAKIVRLLKTNGVLAMNVRPFKRVNGWFDIRFFLIPVLLFRYLNMIDVFVWHNTNPPPTGPTKRNDIHAWELIFVATKAKKSSDYKYFPTFHPYSKKTLNKMKKGNKVRATDVRGSLGGGHNRENPKGARDHNVLSISSSGGKRRKRAKGGSFPFDLARAMIARFTEPGDSVLDPFCGAGTTCVVAEEMGRQWVGIDISAEEIAKGRELMENRA